jgi:uncharacterized protein
MNVLLVTGHPAQVHNFKHLRSELLSKGHQVFWLASDKDISKYLLNCYDIRYTLLKKPGKSFFSKFVTLLQNSFFVAKFIKRNKINMACSRVSPYVSLACFFLRTPHIALTDTETAGFYDKFFGQLVSTLFTAKSFKRQLRSDQIRYDGNIELFYLHPNRFKPSIDVHHLLGIDKNTTYIVMRFVSWDAYHDKGLNGFTDENKLKATLEFSRYTQVFITSENNLPESLEQFRIKIPPECMHDVLANATLFFGESATMASESAVLGTPGIFLDNVGRGYTDEEGQFGLVYNFKSDLTAQQNAIKKGIELLKRQGLKSEIEANLQKFMETKIDMTAFMVWFIETYPESKRIMRENPDYQYNFK